jgi:CubicO group peptidase (beta-lactamase class C family)
LSKPIFAYAVMNLVEECQLDLNVPLATYVPDRWITNDARFLQITARHVLGLRNWRSKEDRFAWRSR